MTRPAVDKKKKDFLSEGLLPPFSFIRDFGKQNTCGNVSKSPSVLRVIDRSDKNPPITATSVAFKPSLRHASGL